MKYFIKVFETLLQKSLKLQRKMTNSGNLFEVSDNGLLSIMYKELLKLTKKKTTTPTKEMEKDINQFTRERQIICLYSHLRAFAHDVLHYMECSFPCSSRAGFYHPSGLSLNIISKQYPLTSPPAIRYYNSLLSPSLHLTQFF